MSDRGRSLPREAVLVSLPRPIPPNIGRFANEGAPPGCRWWDSPGAIERRYRAIDRCGNATGPRMGFQARALSVRGSQTVVTGYRDRSGRVRYRSGCSEGPRRSEGHEN